MHFSEYHNLAAPTKRMVQNVWYKTYGTKRNRTKRIEQNQKI